MALDTRGLASGFAQGFGMMNNYYNQKAQNERAERGLQMREESFEMQKEQYQQAKKKEKATFIYGKIINDLPLADEEQEFLKNNPTYLAALNPDMDQTIEVAERVVDPEDPLDFNSDEALYAMNTGFEAVINRGNGGNKRIAAGLPGAKPGTMSFDLDVEREDGTSERQPLTANRGTADDGDDEVKQVPVENLVNTVQGMRMIRNGFAGVPGGKERAAKMYALLTGKTPERTKGIQINDRLVNPETGEVMADFSAQEDPEPRADWRRLDDGRLYNQRTGEIKGVGGEEGAGGGSGGLESSHLNLVERIGRNTLGKFSSDGTFLGFPEGTQQQYLTGVKRAEELMKYGVSPIEAANIGMLSVTGTIGESEARNLAMEEAESEDFGLFGGDEKTQWVKRRTQEIMDESNTALDKYRQITGARSQGQNQEQGGQPGLQVPGQRQQPEPSQPQGGTSGQVQRDGQTPVVRSDADYERLPAGAIFVDEDGKKYRKPAE